MLIIMILLVGLAGCKPEPDPTAPDAIKNAGLSYKETPLNEEDIVTALKTNEIELKVDPSASYFKLNKVKASIYALPGNERIMLYVYDNAKATKKARLDFAEQTKLMDMNSPLFYNVKNALILYQHHVGGVRPEERTAYNTAIENSIEQLLGDEIYVQHTKFYNIAKLKSFINSFNNHQADQLKVTSLTIEGDPIYTYLLTDGNKLRYASDNSEDAFAGGDKGVSQTECLNIVQQTEEGRNAFYATGCQSGGQRYVLAAPDNAIN
ncbi:DUF4362 domain-containing protein [Paenibacillus glycanilyticus]|uniref:DUF4362 domain-containing protein n=1 Tax=Paenibacillus glycanilyticus TaxID=126569 RepID=UPI00203B49D2|nr:DUF4362 domain-containing protein [Paenibacillus glycanilyticus]MCM3627164.1 DUF4362 domain-containing protein [Paenibacillus glycanilyticus]